MKKSTKIIILVVVGIVMLFLGIVTWFFPYSFFSVNKSVTYDPYNVAVKDYEKGIDDFKKNYEIDKQTQSILNMYEQTWLLSENKVRMKYEDLGGMLNKVQVARKKLRQINLGTISPQEKENRSIIIGNCDVFEKWIEDIKKHKTDSKMKINREYQSMMAGYITSFQIFVEFYEIYEKDNQNTE
ncbi:hypothetical protein [Gottfriedia acidiceleris]|uniref:hypothetical protein n=1 Tax=Gottfriedia acidiceleris TaxID=371036 RepID=UPI00101BA782|nr:hypothetical protein [Gottfriedia acidiceleris]